MIDNQRRTALLLHRGHDPNLRSHVHLPPVVLKHALPLNVSLKIIRKKYWESKMYGRKSAIRLITSLFSYECCHTRTLRILAKNTSTQEINHEFFKFVKQGKVAEVGALLLVANDRILSQGAGRKIIMEMRQFLLGKILCLSVDDSRPQSERETQVFEMEETVKFLEIFGTIGDKLVALSQITNKPTSDIALGIASLIQDAGFHVKAVDVYDSPTLRFGWRPFQSMLDRSVNESSPKVLKTEMLPSWLSQEGFCYEPDKAFDRHLPRPLTKDVSPYPNVPREKLEEEVKRFIGADNKEEFVSYMRSHPGMKNDAITSRLLKLICLHRAAGCATALLNEETGLSVDLNVALEGGLTPLQLAAQTLSLCLTTTLLQHGAQVNLSANNAKTDLAMLPLSMALKAICRDQNLGDWTPEKSVYKLIYILCLKELKEALETIRLLAEATEDIKKFAVQCVEEGEVVQFAALLLVAWDRLVPENAEESLIGRCIWENIGIINNQESLLMLTCGFECEGLECLKKKKKNLLVEWKLLRVLERARELIERYRHRDIDEEVPNYEVPYELACELHKFARMNLTPDDVYSDDVECLRPKLKEEEKVMLNKAINDRLQAMSMLPDFVAQDQAWLNEILEKRHSKMSTFNSHKPICCSQLPFKLSPPSRAYHTSRGFDFRQSLDVHQVASPSTSMFLPTARVCARLCLAAKRSLK